MPTPPSPCPPYTGHTVSGGAQAVWHSTRSLASPPSSQKHLRVAGPGWEPKAGPSDHLDSGRHLPGPVRWTCRWPGPKPKPSKLRSLKGKVSSRDIAADAKPWGLGHSPGTWFGSRTSQSNLQHLLSSWSRQEAGGVRATGGRQVWGYGVGAGGRGERGKAPAGLRLQPKPSQQRAHILPEVPHPGAHVQRGRPLWSCLPAPSAPKLVPRLQPSPLPSSASITAIAGVSPATGAHTQEGAGAASPAVSAHRPRTEAHDQFTCL